MHRSGYRRRGRLLLVTAMLVVASLTMVFVGGCGGDDAEDVETTTTAASSGSSGGSGNASQEAGVAMADKILAAFDELAGKVAALANAKPEPATLKPQLEELYNSYMPKMTELNAEFLALRDSDKFAFQSANGRLSDNRPQRITAMENSMLEAIKHYNFDLGDQEIVTPLTKKPIELLDIAVKQ